MSEDSKEKIYAVGFKGFDPDMKCQGKQYAENEIFEEKTAEICNSGMHFCENPLDVLDYYPLLTGDCKLNEFATVEALAEATTEDKKSVTTKLKVGFKLGLKGFVEAAVAFSLEWLKKVDYSVKNAASSGFGSQLASSGKYSKLASSGDESQLASSGDYSKLASSGKYSKLASSGDSSQLASSGKYSQLASSGFGSQLASSGKYSQLASSGDYSKLASSGDYCSVEATGEKCVIAATGRDSKVKGALGCFIACAEWALDKNYNWHPVAFKSAKVDGKKIKADTWYTVKNGKFVEVKDGE